MRRILVALSLLAMLWAPSVNSQKNWQPQDLTPGAVLRVEYTQRIPGVVSSEDRQPERRVARLRADGFPKQEKLALSTWTLSSEEKADSIKPIPVVINESGEVRKEDGKEFLLGFSEEAAGETYIFGLATQDARVRALVRATPFPIEARSGTCRLFAEAVEPLGAAFRITASGFAPEDDLKITTAANKNSVESAGKTQADGAWQGRVPLLVEGQKVSKIKLTVKGKSCSVNVSLSRRTPSPPPQ